MTAVEFLEKICNDRGYHLMEEYFEQAKQMERLQLADAQSYAISNADMTNNRGYFDCDKWYAETYGNDETLKDNHIVDTNEMVEISDEEIEEYAKENAFQYYEFIRGAKWYREQLKSRQ